MPAVRAPQTGPPYGEGEKQPINTSKFPISTPSKYPFNASKQHINTSKQPINTSPYGEGEGVVDGGAGGVGLCEMHLSERGEQRQVHGLPRGGARLGRHGVAREVRGAPGDKG